MPTGDEKVVAQDYAVSFGGNAVSAAFCCAKLGIVPELMTSLADDWLARMFLDMAAKYGISVHGRKVRESSLSFVMPNHGMRAIIRCRDDHYLHPVPPLDISGCRALHLDGHQADAALHYARACREAGIFTSLDGGGVRSNTVELLSFIDVAVLSERFCEQLHISPAEALDLLKEKGCRIGGVTMGERGLLWYDEKGNVARLPALSVPREEIVDTNGAGDVFHGAYVYSRITHPDAPWEAHFRFARAASAHAIRYLGNEARLPALADVEATGKLYHPAVAVTG
jgi:sugar/nucleoside kinase (ribokinase family)